MLAVVINEPGSAAVLHFEEIATPRPASNEVTIQVHVCGLCFHDVVARNGVMKKRGKFPHVPGHEIAGTITTVGIDVSGWNVGDRVATTLRRHVCGQCEKCRSGREASCPQRVGLGSSMNGGCAEYVLVDQDNLARVPDNVPMEHAAIAACAIGTQYNAIRDIARVQMGERVLITGASGGLGMHGIQLARLSGAHVVALTTSPDKAEVLKKAGAHTVVSVERGADFSAEVRAATGGAGVDVVIDNVGSPVFEPVRRSLAPGARWVLVGQVTGEFVKFNPAQLFFQDITILSAKSASRHQLVRVLELMERGLITPIVTVMPIVDVARAHELVEDGKSVGRIVLDVTSLAQARQR